VKFSRTFANDGYSGVRRALHFVCIVMSVSFAQADASLARELPLRGINLSGAELNVEKLPGRLNFDYVYPTQDELDHAAEMGMSVIRLPVLWERLQPHLDGPLDERELGQLHATIRAAGRRNLKVIIDAHDYGAYKGQKVGASSETTRAFAEFWRLMALAFLERDNVIFGLMNEPNGIDAGAWFEAAQRALRAIRAVGFKRLVLVPGTGWDSASNFVSGAGYGTPNASVLGNLEDPGHAMAIEVHQYLDEYGSGTHPECRAADEVIALLEPFTSWLRTHQRRGFLGEFGVSRAPRCLDSLAAMLRYMADNSDVWLGWTYWAGGRWWSRDYAFSVEPVDGQDRPQMRVLQEFLPKTPLAARQP
jgi:endoglucanase